MQIWERLDESAGKWRGRGEQATADGVAVDQLVEELARLCSIPCQD